MESTENARKRRSEEEASTSNVKVRKTEEIPSDEPLEGEAIAKEMHLFNKMREEAVERMKKQFNVVFVRDFLLPVVKEFTVEEFATIELEIYFQSMINPSSLQYAYLPNGKFIVYQGKQRKNGHPLSINGSYEVDNSTLADRGPEDPLEDYDF